jgi:hypothetical protein
MKVLDLDGSAYERGRRQGLEMREQHRLLLRDFLSSAIWREHKPGFLPNPLVFQALGLAGSLSIKKAVSDTLPVQAARIRGLAEGLGISERLCWGIQFMEILLCEAGRSMQAPAGCTQIHARPEATAAKKPLSARNYDFPNLLRPYQVVRREIAAEAGRFATTTVTQVSMAGAHQGINEHGLMVCVNNARLWKGGDFRYRGVPYQLILVEALETCRTTAEAVKLITEFPARANAGFFGIADTAGDARIVEFTASRCAVREPDELGVMAQTNHFLQMADANLPAGTFWTVKGMEGLEFALSTKSRYETAYARLAEAAGKITVQTMMEILQDHSAGGGAGNDCTVCCHGLAGGTLGSIVVDLASGKIWVAEGNPCQYAYELVEFRRGPRVTLRH